MKHPDLVPAILAHTGLKGILELSRATGIRHSVFYKHRAFGTELSIDTRRRIVAAFPETAALMVADIITPRLSQPAESVA